jgi:hypothetical protein
MQQIPVKRLKVPNIEDDAVTLGYGPLIHRVRAHNIKERITSPPGIGDPLQ